MDEILKSFDYKSLLLFRNFNSENNADDSEDLVVYDFMLKIDNENSNRKVDLYFVIKYLLDNQFKHKQSLKLKFKNLLKFDTNDENSDFLGKYDELTNQFLVILQSEPYTLFYRNKIINDPKKISRKLEICLQIIFNYLYYIVYKIEKEKLPKNPPRSIKQAILNNKNIKCIYTNQNCFYLLNSFFRFYKKLPKATKFLIGDNESILEIYLLLICLQNDFDNKFLHRNKKLLKYFNIKKTIQTSIMLINLNKDKPVITKGISNILTYLLYFNHNYIMILIDIFNDSNFNLDHCAILIKKIILSIPSHVNKDNYYRKLINYLVSLIISKVEDEISEGIKVFLVDILNSTITKFSDDYSFSQILFDIFFSKLYSKFGYKIFNNNLKIDLNKPKEKEKITPRQVKFIKFLIDNFNIAIKSRFSRIFHANSEFIKINLTILFKLWNKSSFYYDNIENENLKTLQTFFSLILENVENSNLATKTVKFVKFLTHSVFKDAQKFDATFTDIDLDLENLTINHIKMSHVYYILYVSSFEYSLYCQNFIENIFKTLPFKNVVNDVLNMFLNGKISLNTIDVDLFLFNLENAESSALISKEELQTNLIKINNLSKIVKHKLLVTLLSLISDFNDILSVENALRFLTFILSQSYEEYGHYEDLEVILNCTKIVVSKIKDEKLKSFQLCKIILEFLPHLEQLIESHSEYNQVYLDLKEILNNSPDTFCEELSSDKIDLKNVYALLFEAEKILSNIDKSYKLKEVNNLLVKSSLGNSNLSSELIKNMFNVILKINKICEIHISKICQKLFVNLFEIILNSEDNQIQIIFFFNLIFTNIIENANRTIEDQQLISLENQSSLKLIEIIDKIIKRNKYACVLFMKEITENIFLLFDNYYNKLNHIFISSLLSVLANLVNYCPFEMSNYLSTLIKTSFNHLKSDTCDKEIKRSSALILFKIIQNCDFLHYKVYAREIYETIIRSIENSKDKVLTYHLNQCMKLIKEYLEEFYKI